LVSACVFSTSRDGKKSDSESPETNAVRLDSEKKSDRKTDEKYEDKGDFKVENVSITNSRYAALDRKVKDEKLLENAAEDLNRALKLPGDITIRAQSCGVENAEFDPNNNRITICYELMERFYNLYRLEGLDEKKANEKMFDAIRFVFLHEVGHALIDNYKLPVTGNEEDAADRCSSYINIEELGEKGVRAVLAAADAFRIDSRRSSPGKKDLADEHLLNEQRFYKSLCMIYGSDPSKYEYFVKEGYLPKERAVRCPQEYQRTVESWTSLLEPWRKS
jgi:hypothetical protein